MASQNSEGARQAEAKRLGLGLTPNPGSSVLGISYIARSPLFCTLHIKTTWGEKKQDKKTVLGLYIEGRAYETRQGNQLGGSA